MKQATPNAIFLQASFEQFNIDINEKKFPKLLYIADHFTKEFEFWGGTFESFLGYSQSEVFEIGSDCLTNLCHPDDVRKLGSHLQAIQDLADDEIACLETRFRSTSGSWVWIHLQSKVHERDKIGRVIKHIGSAQDISSLKMAEQEATKAQHAAKSINEELHAFAYSTSHDLKSPANSISYLLSTLIEDYGNEIPFGARELIEMGLRTSDRMCAMVDDTLEYAKIIGEETEFTTLNLNQITKTVIQGMSQQVLDSDAAIEVEPLPKVQGSQEQLFIFIKHLIDNSMKYRSENRKPLIKIFAELTDDPKFCRLSIQDNGVGIPGSQLSKATQLYKRVHAGAKYTGSGLGLSICKRICFNHNSDLLIESIVNKGSTISIQLEMVLSDKSEW